MRHQHGKPAARLKAVVQAHADRVIGVIAIPSWASP